MICSKCNKFNMDGDVFCRYCGASLADILDPKQEIKKETFAEGENQGCAENQDFILGGGYLKNIRDDIRDMDISFEEDFEFVSSGFDEDDSEIKMSNVEKSEFRNMAIIAVILAVLIDTLLTIVIIMCSRGFAKDIVGVNREAYYISENIKEG